MKFLIFALLIYCLIRCLDHQAWKRHNEQQLRLFDFLHRIKSK